MVRIPFIVAAELSVSPYSDKYLFAAKEISTRFIPNNEDDLEFITNLPDKLKKGLKANDCLIISLCKRTGGELLTFDKKLKKITLTLKL